MKREVEKTLGLAGPPAGFVALVYLKTLRFLFIFPEKYFVSRHLRWTLSLIMHDTLGAAHHLPAL